MSMKKLEQFDAIDVSKSLCGLFLKEGEKNKLYELCIKYEIEIHYPNLFTDDTHYSLWGISKKFFNLFLFKCLIVCGVAISAGFLKFLS